MSLFGTRSIFSGNNISFDLKAVKKRLRASAGGGVSVVDVPVEDDSNEIKLPGDPGTIQKHSPKAKKSPHAPTLRGRTNNVQQRIEEEWKKIANPETGFSYFCKNYVWINNQRHGYMQFVLYGYQERIASMLGKHRFVITKKFRQAGMSLLTGVYCLWYSLCNARMQCLIVSIGMRESSKYLQENVREIYDAMPQWLRGGLDAKGKPINWKKPRAPKDAATELVLPNKAKIRSIPSGKSVGRSFSTKILIVDEAAFVEDMERFWLSIYPTINNAGGSVFVVSTVNGVGNWYYSTYKGAENDENEFKIGHMEFPEHPDYNDPHWVEQTKRQIGIRGWRQEVLGEFLASGNTFIDADTILWLEGNCEEPLRKEWGGKLWVWEDFVPGHKYVLGADCATQGGLDYSSISVFDMMTGNQVAEYRGKVHEDMFAQRIAEIGYLYGSCLAAVEINAKPGGSVVTSLRRVQRYKRLFKQVKSGEAGWLTNQRSRNNLVAHMESAIYDQSRPWKIKSTRMVDEFKTFIVTESGKIEHDKGCNDDLIFALMIAIVPEVQQQAGRFKPRQVHALKVVDDPSGEGFVGTVVPVHLEGDDLENTRAKRRDLIGNTGYGRQLAYREKLDEVAGEDVIGWLLEDVGDDNK